jgi:hypothetical protein
MEFLNVEKLTGPVLIGMNVDTAYARSCNIERRPHRT